MKDPITGATAIALETSQIIGAPTVTLDRDQILGAPAIAPAAMRDQISGALAITLNTMRDPRPGAQRIAPAVMTNHPTDQSQYATVVEKRPLYSQMPRCTR